MNTDTSSLKRIREFMELIQRAKEAGSEPSFLTTPTEHGDNINVLVTLNGERHNAGIVFWDLSWLQNQGLADTLDEEDIALGMNITDGLVEDAEKILEFVNKELEKLTGT